MKKTPLLLYCKQAVALFFTFLFLLTLPSGTVSAAQISADSALSAEAGTEEPMSVTDTTDAPSTSGSEADTPAPDVFDIDFPAEEASVPLSEEEAEPLPDTSGSATVWAYGGQQLTFVDLLWRSTSVEGVDAVFMGSTETTVVSMTAGERGLFTVTIPSGSYERVAFYPAGQADTAQPLGGVWRLDGQADDTAAAVNFAAGTQSAFYYDSGDSPSYWGPDPNYDSGSAPMTLADSQAGNPQQGDQLYFVNLHKLKGDETDPIVTVEARFIQLPHDGTDSPNWTNGKQYIGRTMYEVRDGVYVVPFPQEITESSPTNTSGYLYEEVAFNLTRQSGQKDPFNRHYNFRGQRNTSSVSGTWGTPGYFNYVAGTMDAYYYNTNVEDSYWNAHPSNADVSIQAQLLYVDTRDFGKTSYQNITDIYLSWEGMPTDQENYHESYGVRLGVTVQGEENPYATGTDGIYFYKMPVSSPALTENTVFTLTYVIDEGTHTGTHTFLFTYVPRSGYNTIMMDYLWEDVGEVWGVYQAAPSGDTSVHSVYFNNAVTAFEKVQVVFGKSLENGEVDWMTGTDAWDIAQVDGWTQGLLADQEVNEADYKSWQKGWLNMTLQSGPLDGYELPANVWGIDQVPTEYDRVMFRGTLSKETADSNTENTWFTPFLTIDQTYQYPCFFAYRYIGADHATGAPEKDVVPGDTSYLDGQWGSALEIYDLGDNSIQIASGDFQVEDNTYYATSTLYDYYSLGELSGHSVTEGGNNSRHQDQQGALLNIAVSKYFKALDQNAGNTADTGSDPLYFGSGNMTNDKNVGWGYALSNPNANFYNLGMLYKITELYNNTYRANIWEQDDGSRTGLLDSLLRNDTVTLNGFETPYFSEAFLRGDNALNITLGNVYHNIRFPFSLNEEGYWEYDSAKNGRTLKQDPDGTYFMQDTDPFNINGQSNASYMPFHEATADSTAAAMGNLNYMFGQRFDLTFTVPEGGQVNMPDPGQLEVMKDVIFEFQGDDDCWIFIDGQLVLDMGGIHDTVRGTLNFHTGEFNTYANIDKSTTQADGTVTPSEEKKDQSGKFVLSGDENTVHTLTMFYFERGLYASNLKMTFNFPQQNQLRVTKIVDESNVNTLFADAMDNLGSFEVHLDTMATSGQPLAVENSAGYVDTKTLVFYEPGASASAAVIGSTGVVATEQSDNTGKYLNITQPTGWASGTPPDKDNLLTLEPTTKTIDLEKYAFLELELYNATTDNRGAELYIQLQDQKGQTVTASARTAGYLGEANLFLPNIQSLVRIDLNALIAANPAFDRTKVTAVRIGLQKGTGAGSEDTGHYRLYRASFGTQWNLVLSTGFSVGDDQISDYGSINAKTYQPANGAWYTRQTTDEGGNVTESVTSVVQNGSLSLADGQTAVFTDKFRVGSYLLLEENVDTNLFETTWSIRESGQPVSFNSLLPDRPNVSTVKNPDWGFTRGETPLENQVGTVPYDGRSVPDVSAPAAPEGSQDVGFVYRSYLYPDNNENLPVDLEVIFRNKMRTGNFTIQKQLDDSMKVDGLYPVGVYTFDVYYTNVGGRGLEQFLPSQPMVDGVGDHYIHQVVEITTGSTNGYGEFVMEGVPAGTQYIIRERPANGATLVGLEATGGDSASNSPIQGVVTTDGNVDDYANAYIQDSTYLLEESQTDANYPVYTFTNKNELFYMQIQKVWQGEPPTNVEEIHIQVQRREAGSQNEDDWKNVTNDIFGETGGTVTLKKEYNWKVSSEMPVYPTSGTEEGQTILYEYRIVEIGVGEGELASYRVEYTQVSGGTTSGGHSIVTYQAHNIPTGLTLQKTWLDNQNRDNTRPAAVRVQLRRSANYDPQNPTAENVTWQTLNAQGEPVADEDAETSFITLQSPDWSYTLEKLAASVTEENDIVRPYYYRLQEVQVQDTSGNWVPIEEQNIYEPAYSLPVTLGQAAALTVENALKTAEIQVTKQDAQNANTLLSGAKFTLERLMQTAEGEWIVDTEWTPLTGTTGVDGTCTFRGLRPGRYRLTEIKAPEEYQASLTPTDITLGAEHLKDTVRVTVKNSRPLTFAFTKVAAEDHSKVLSGAEFALYALACGDASHTHTELLDPDAPGSCWVKVQQDATSTGTVTFENLAFGTYRLIEIKAPGGYALPTGQWQVTLKADGSVTPVGINNPPAFLNEGGGLKLTNRKPMDMPSSGGPGVPLAAALGVLMMGAGLLLTGNQMRKKHGKHTK